MATKLNLFIDQGSDFETSIVITDETGEPIDITEFTGRSQIRRHYTSLAAIDFFIDIGNEGVVTLALPANTSSNMASGRYVYDVELVSPTGVVSRVVEGVVSINPEVTR